LSDPLIICKDVYKLKKSVRKRAWFSSRADIRRWIIERKQAYHNYPTGKLLTKHETWK